MITFVAINKITMNEILRVLGSYGWIGSIVESLIEPDDKRLLWHNTASGIVYYFDYSLSTWDEITQIEELPDMSKCPSIPQRGTVYIALAEKRLYVPSGSAYVIKILNNAGAGIKTTVASDEVLVVREGYQHTVHQTGLVVDGEVLIEGHLIMD